MAFAPRERPPRRSRLLPKELEDELRVLVFDQGNNTYNGDPDLIIGNPETGCYGLCYLNPNGTKFIFHHVATKYATTCKCLVHGEKGDETFQIPHSLDLQRLRLILIGPIRMEPKLAAMVVMKAFLGMELPEQLRLPRHTRREPQDLQASQESRESKEADEEADEEVDVAGQAGNG
ncbi:hypothetical protein M426DRAFT_6588 [Hypoxylon sp. CI-4A]|nr:hypothetical protein M426DRAFT_6588 [Hypoxylon sp. CI-4A]